MNLNDCLMDTESEWYAKRLHDKQGKTWKRLIRAQAPYQWNLRRQQLGRTLDVGCGIGRNLATLGAGSMGVDHNVQAVEEARSQGFQAVTTDEFDSRPPEFESFDGLLVAHVIEHMDAAAGRALLTHYLPYVRPGGKAFFICPQERGYASDPTHVRFTTGDDLAELARSVGLQPGNPSSFPFPRFMGKAFIYNEFTLVAVKPG